MGLFDNNLIRVRRAKTYQGATDYDISSVGTLVSITNDNAYGAALIIVSAVSDGAEIIAYFDNAIYKTPIYDATTGDMLMAITKKGRYYVNMNGEATFVLRNLKAVPSGTATIAVNFVENVPDSVLLRKPVQLIGQATVELNSLSRITIFNDIRVADFKYYFIAYFLRNGSGSVVRKIKIEAQPYHPFTFQASNMPGLVETIIDEQNTYSFQTDWQRVRGDGLRVYFTELESSITEGDMVSVDLYGVR